MHGEIEIIDQESFSMAASDDIGPRVVHAGTVLAQHAQFDNWFQDGAQEPCRLRSELRAMLSAGDPGTNPELVDEVERIVRAIDGWFPMQAFNDFWKFTEHESPVGRLLREIDWRREYRRGHEPLSGTCPAL